MDIIRPYKLFYHCFFLIFLISGFLSFYTANGQSTREWNGVGAGNWFNNNNWVSSGSALKNLLEWNGFGTTTSNNNFTLGPTDFFRRLTFNGSVSYTITGNNIRLLDNRNGAVYYARLLNQSDVLQTISAPLLFDDFEKIGLISTVEAGSFVLGDISLGNDISVLRMAGEYNTGSITVDGNISGSKSITIGIDGDDVSKPNTRVALSGNNAGFSGAISVLAGALTLLNGNSAGVSTDNSIEISSGSMLDIKPANGTGMTLSGKTIIFQGNGLNTSAAIRNVIGNNIIQGDILLSGNGQLGAINGTTLTLNNIGVLNENQVVDLQINTNATIQGWSKVIVEGAIGDINNYPFRNLTKGSTGTLLLKGHVNITNTLRISSPTIGTDTCAVEIQGSNLINSAASLELRGGTFRLFTSGSGVGYSQSFSKLILNASQQSMIELGAGAHSLQFGNSSDIPWSQGNNSRIRITGWSGIAGGPASGSGGRIFIEQADLSTPGLTETQLKSITFNGFCNGASIIPVAGFSMLGELVPSSLPYINSVSGNPPGGQAGANAGYIGSVISITGCQFTNANQITVGATAINFPPANILSDIGMNFTLGKDVFGAVSIISPNGTRSHTVDLINLGYFASGSNEQIWETPSIWYNNSLVPVSGYPVTLQHRLRITSKIADLNPGGPPYLNSIKINQVNSASLKLAAPGGDLIWDNTPIILNGGSFRTYNNPTNNYTPLTIGYSETVGTLSVQANSTLALGTGVHELRFANSSAIDWAANQTLTIRNWIGTPGGSGTAGKIFFGTDANALTADQLDKIVFTGFCNRATLTSSGELIPSIQPLATSFSGSPGAPGAVYIGGTINLTGCEIDNLSKIKVGSIELFPVDFFNVTETGVSFIYTASMGSNPIQLYIDDVFSHQSAPIRNMGYISTTTGTWTDPATWLGVGVPGLGLNVTIAADHLVDIDLDILIENRPDTIFTKASGILDVDDGLIIHIAKGLVNDGQFITGENTRLEFVNSGAILRNNGLFKDGLHELPGNVNFLSKASITGSSAITFNNLTINSDTVSLPLSMQQVPSIKGTLTINGGIFRTAANAVGPIYLSGSNLIYKTGTIYQRGVEWNCTHIAIAGTTAGYPHNVVIDNNTTLNLRNNLLPAPLPSVGSPILPVFGNLSIYRGGLVNNLAAPYGPVQINGNLQQGSDPDLTANITFGSNSNARIIIEGDFERKFISNSNIPYTNPFRFIGPGNSHLTLAGSMGFRRLEINKLNGAEVILGSEVKITEALILTEGTIKTNAIGSKFLFLDSLASITGGNSTSFVDGPLHKITTPTGDGSLDFEFPVGKKLDQNTLRYRPVWITNLNNSGNTTFSAEYNYSSTTANPFSNNEFIDPNLNGIWGDQWWQMDRVSGTGKARVGIKVAPQASWFPISPCINCRVGVVRHNSLTNSWEFTKPFGVFANENNTYPEAFESALIGTVYSGILSGFSPFTIGFGYPVVLPLQILAFDAVLWGNDAKLNWKLADGHELKRMVVEHGTDGRSFAEIGLVNYEQKNDYEFLHKNIGPGVHYYRIKMESKDGKILYSKVDFVVNKADKTIISGLIQNPVIGGMAMLKVYSPGPQRLEAGVYDMAGRMLLRQQVSLQQGNNIPMLSLAVLPQGIYRIVIKTEDGAMQTLSALKN